MKGRLVHACASLAALACFAAHGIEIVITHGWDAPTKIAVVPFGGPSLTDRPEGAPVNLSGIVAFDLMRSGQFDALPTDNMLSMPTTAAEVHFRDWRILGMDYVVIGRGSRLEDGRVQVTYTLFDVPSERGVNSLTYRALPGNLRDIAHWIADDVYEQVTGVKGAFSTRLVYVLVRDPGTSQAVYSLMVADADGEREREVYRSTEPILSPSWGPEGRRLAYVSFETGRSTIVVQDLATGVRQRVAEYPGINGAPVFSPDGQSMAMSLSRDGNSEIYVKNLNTQKLRRVTRRPSAIDTEPSWGPDGESLIFTSDRAGQPQIYRIDLATSLADRLTFQGSYNARARLLPNGRHLVYVHRRNGVYHIAWQDLERDVVKVLTETSLDESPSLAPNGMMMIYATQQHGQGILAVVSVDSRVRYNLPSGLGDVREPAWSSFMTVDAQTLVSHAALAR